METLQTPDQRVRAPRRQVRDGPLLASVAWGVAVLGAAVVSILVTVVFAVLAALGGERSREKISDAAQGLSATWATLIASQTVTLVVALLACRLVGAPARARLGLSAAALGPVRTGALIVATIVPFAVGLLAAAGVQALGWPPSESALTRMWAEGSRARSVFWVLSIAVIPGFVEEVFYRGLVLRGLLMRWRPLPAILASSALFAGAHVDPAHAAFTSVIGVWFGFVAWRTGSVVLPAVMHAGINGSWTAIQMIAARSTIGDMAANIGAAIALGAGIGAFLWAVRILARCDPSAAPGPTARGSWRRTVLAAGCAIVGGAVLLYAILPPGIVPPTPAAAPTLSSLRERAASTVECPGEGEIVFTLSRGQAVRVTLPTNRLGVPEAIVALGDQDDVVWLAYSGEVTGKGTRQGIPRAGIIEQLRAGDPTLLRIRFDAGPDPLAVRLSLLQDQGEIDAAWALASPGAGWAIRGR